MKLVSISRYGLHSLGAAGCAVILVCSFAFVYHPLKRQEAEVLNRRETVARFAATRDTVLQRNRKLSQTEAELAKNVALLSQRISRNSQDHDLLRELSHFAQNSRIQLIDFQPAGFGRFHALQTRVVRISLRGDYSGICMFLSELQKSDRLQRLTYWHFNLSDRKAGTFDVRVEIQEYLKTKPRSH